MRFKKSLSARVFLTVFSALVVVLLLSRLGFHYLADDFYYNIKTQEMQQTATSIASMLEYESDKDTINDELQHQATLLGGIIFVSDKSNNIIYSSITLRGNRNFGNPMQPGMGQHMNPYRNIITPSNLRADNIYYSINESDQMHLINYKLEGDYYDIVTALPVPAIDDTIEAISKIFNYVIALALIVALITSIFVARNISYPLIELNNVATELGQLNFSSRYEIKRDDEIGQLGNTINNLAIQLQQTISRLKQELQKERHSEKLRRNFVARASHELQTPLAVINGYTEALQDGVVENEEEKEYFYNIIKDETVKLSSMVHDLLELSRLENPEFTINKKIFALDALLIQLVEKQLHINETNSISVITAELGQEYLVNGDKMRIEQAVNNILRNAVRHTPQDGFIKITAERVGKELTVNIINSGSHIDEVNLPNIWDSFYTTDVDGGTTGGTGLGLAIAKQIFLRHNCVFGAENIAEGVRFWFTIGLI